MNIQSNFTQTKKAAKKSDLFLDFEEKQSRQRKRGKINRKQARQNKRTF